MLKIWSLKQQQQKEGGDGAGPKMKKVTAAYLRVQKDLSELSLPPNMETSFKDPEDLMNFELMLKPDEGLYQGGKFHFSFAINASFPHEPPKVKCLDKIYHPNIDLEGNVCLNILREDWKPVLTLNSVMIGIQYLFVEPNPSDPLNKDAATSLVKDRNRFAREVTSSMRGGWVGDVRFDPVI